MGTEPFLKKVMFKHGLCNVFCVFGGLSDGLIRKVLQCSTGLSDDQNLLGHFITRNFHRMDPMFRYIPRKVFQALQKLLLSWKSENQTDLS